MNSWVSSPEPKVTVARQKDGCYLVTLHTPQGARSEVLDAEGVFTFMTVFLEEHSGVEL